MNFKIKFNKLFHVLIGMQIISTFGGRPSSEMGLVDGNESSSANGALNEIEPDCIMQVGNVDYRLKVNGYTREINVYKVNERRPDILRTMSFFGKMFSFKRTTNTGSSMDISESEFDCIKQRLLAISRKTNAFPVITDAVVKFYNKIFDADVPTQEDEAKYSLTYNTSLAVSQARMMSFLEAYEPFINDRKSNLALLIENFKDFKELKLKARELVILETRSDEDRFKNDCEIPDLGCPPPKISWAGFEFENSDEIQDDQHNTKTQDSDFDPGASSAPHEAYNPQAQVEIGWTMYHLVPTYFPNGTVEISFFTTKGEKNNEDPIKDLLSWDSPREGESNDYFVKKMIELIQTCRQSNLEPYAMLTSILCSLPTFTHAVKEMNIGRLRKYSSKFLLPESFSKILQDRARGNGHNPHLMSSLMQDSLIKDRILMLMSLLRQYIPALVLDALDQGVLLFFKAILPIACENYKARLRVLDPKVALINASLQSSGLLQGQGLLLVPVQVFPAILVPAEPMLVPAWQYTGQQYATSEGEGREGLDSSDIITFTPRSDI